ncbi:hypothetical protein A2U01_0004727, partial [Trifolium medium]|nr:hypothetical protein [Trifolium medium]
PAELSQLNGRLHFGDARRVTDVEYRRPSVCSDKIVLFTNMKLQNDGDVRTNVLYFLSVQYEKINRARRYVG